MSIVEVNRFPCKDDDGMEYTVIDHPPLQWEYHPEPTSGPFYRL